MSLDLHTMSDGRSNSPPIGLTRSASRSSARRHGVRDDETQVIEPLTQSSASGNYSGRCEGTYGIPKEENDVILAEKISALKSRMPDCFFSVTTNGIRITLKAEPMERQDTDVVVNSTKNVLRVGGWGILNRNSVTYALCKAAGPVASESVRKKYPDGIGTGEMAIGDSGNLPCKKLYHVILERYGYYRHAEKAETLKRVVNSSLQTAEQMGYTSIAFPALGTGNLGYPPAVVATTMLGCFVNYAMKQRNTPIKEIVMVTGIREGGAVSQAFQFEEQRRQVSMLTPPVSSMPLVKEPTWLCHSYMHIATHSQAELDCIVKELSMTRRSSIVESIKY